jgi:hypothetical protein
LIFDILDENKKAKKLNKEKAVWKPQNKF